MSRLSDPIDGQSPSPDPGRSEQPVFGGSIGVQDAAVPGSEPGGSVQGAAGSEPLVEGKVVSGSGELGDFHGDVLSFCAAGTTLLLAIFVVLCLIFGSQLVRFFYDRFRS